MIHSKYRVERVIGEGGMGLVVAAKHLTLDRSVAIKLLNSKSRQSDEAIERFTREARAAARIQSEHVGRVLDVDKLPNGTPFIVMELLSGHDLASELTSSPGGISVSRAVTFILQACEAIAEAHIAGIVHRDLKPANLFLSKTSSGHVTVKVLDFGISKITRREEEAASTDNKALTNAGSMLGSPLYMSPEQMQGIQTVDARTDIWSLGVILYELVTGRSPFDGATIPVICATVLASPPPPLNLPDAPPNFEKVVLRCLEKDPSKRYRDIAHFVRALAQFEPEQGAITLDRVSKLKDENGAIASSPASIAPPKEGSLTITSWGEKAVPSPKRKWLPLAFAGVGVVLVGGFAAQSYLSSPSAPAPAVAAADQPATSTADPTATAASTSLASATQDSPAASASAAPPSTEGTTTASVSAAASSSTPTSVRPVRPVRPPPTSKTGKKTDWGGRN